MSAIANFFLLPSDKLIGLSELWPDYYNYVREHATEYFRDYGWSGYCIAVLLEYLKSEKNIDLGSSDYALVFPGAYNDGFWFFDKPLRDKYLKSLDPDLFSDEELHAYAVANGFEELDAPAQPLRDGLDIFKKAMELVNENAVMLVHVG